MLLATMLLGCTGDVERTKKPGPLAFRGPAPTNLLFLSVDTFRKDHTGFHGASGPMTPFMDALAADGVVLDDFQHCSNWTMASTTCALSGRTNVERVHLPRLTGDPALKLPVPEGTELLATWLGQAGYATALSSSNVFLSDAPNVGNAQGFDAVFQQAGPVSAIRATGVELLADLREQGQPWFLHLHFLEPHASYDPPESAILGGEDLPPWPTDLTNKDIHYAAKATWPDLDPADQELLEAHLRVLYEGEIRTFDRRLETAWALLGDEGWLDDTLVVLFNDHGEQFWEHREQAHAHKLYGEENDGFAVFWAHDILPGHFAGPTASIDLVPTVLTLLDLDVPDVVTGLPIGEADDDRTRIATALGLQGGRAAVSRDGWKMHYDFEGIVTVHDRSVDPAEAVDLFDPADPWQLELWAELRATVEAMEPAILQPGPTPVWPDTLP